MSSNVFPALPGLDVAVEIEPSYVTTTHTTISRKEQRTSWSASSRTVYRLRFNGLRESVMAPAPWAAYSEVAIVRKFHDDHRGGWDSFLWNEPYGGTQIRVRFVEDSLKLRRKVNGWWTAEFDLVSVL